jgi:hypothetical protein
MTHISGKKKYVTLFDSSGRKLCLHRKPTGDGTRLEYVRVKDIFVIA